MDSNILNGLSPRHVSQIVRRKMSQKHHGDSNLYTRKSKHKKDYGKDKDYQSCKNMLMFTLLKSIPYKEAIIVELTMHADKPEHGYYSTRVCEKCEPKFQIDRRRPTE